MSKSKSLGKGLNALLPSADEGMPGDDSIPSGKYILCPINRIEPNPFQPRKEMSSSSLKQLAASISEKGVLQPLLVRAKKSDSNFELIAGERRLQAAKIAGLKEVPVLIKKDTQEVDRLELAIIENIQRQDLNVLEEAEAFERLMKEFGHTQEEVAQKVGKDRSTVANTLRLLQLPKFAMEDLASGKISAGHARVILSMPDPESMKMLHAEIISKKLSVREAESLAKKFKTSGITPIPKTASGDSKKKDAGEIPVSYCKTLINDLVRHLDTKAKIVQNGSRGKIELEYYSMDDLERLISLITGNPPVS